MKHVSLDSDTDMMVQEVKKHACRDRVARERGACLERPEPHSLSDGPKTRREFLNLLTWSGGARARTRCVLALRARTRPRRLRKAARSGPG